MIGDGDYTNAQAIIFTKKKWTTKRARAWLLAKNLKRIKRVVTTKKRYRYRIKDPAIYKSFSTRKTSKGISVIIGLF